MRVIIAGSRNTSNADREVADAITASKFNITEVVCGQSGNVDLAGKRWGDANGVFVKDFFADWDSFGKAAGPKRNQEMAGYAFFGPDGTKGIGDGGLIMLWDGSSRGTANMAAHAAICGLKIYAVLV